MSLHIETCRPAAGGASSSVPGIAAETIPEDEQEEDAAPTPEQLEVSVYQRLPIVHAEPLNTHTVHLCTPLCDAQYIHQM